MANGINIPIGFQITGMQNLVRARNAIKSFGAHSYGSLNQAMRGSSALNKSFGQLGATIAKISTLGGLAILSRKMIDATAELQSSKIIFTAIMGDAQRANNAIEKLQMSALNMGVDQAEMIKSARGILSSARQINPKVSDSEVQKLTEMAALLSQLDVENRGVSYAAFSIKEVLQGTGMADFKSLTDRLEISLQKSTKQGITKALKAGDLSKAVQLFEDGLKRAGLGMHLIEAMKRGSFQTNMTRIFGFAGVAAQKAIMPTLDLLAQTMYGVNEGIAESLKPGASLYEKLNEKGIFLRDNVVRPILNFIGQINDQIRIIGANTDFITQWKFLVTGVFNILSSVATVIGSFVQGFFDTNDGADALKRTALDFAVTTERIKNKIQEWAPKIREAGRHFKEFLANVGRLFERIGGVKTVIGVILAMKVGGFLFSLPIKLMAAVGLATQLRNILFSINNMPGGGPGPMGGGPKIFGGGQQRIKTMGNPAITNGLFRVSKFGRAGEFPVGTSIPFSAKQSRTVIQTSKLLEDEIKAARKGAMARGLAVPGLGGANQTSRFGSIGNFSRSILGRIPGFNNTANTSRQLSGMAKNIFSAIKGNILRAVNAFKGKNMLATFAKGNIVSIVLSLLDTFTGDVKHKFSFLTDKMKQWGGLIAFVSGLVATALAFFTPFGPIVLVLEAIAGLGMIIAGAGAAVDLAAKAWNALKGGVIYNEPAGPNKPSLSNKQLTTDPTINAKAGGLPPILPQKHSSKPQTVQTANVTQTFHFHGVDPKQIDKELKGVGKAGLEAWQSVFPVSG